MTEVELIAALSGMIIGMVVYDVIKLICSRI